MQMQKNEKKRKNVGNVVKLIKENHAFAWFRFRKILELNNRNPLLSAEVLKLYSGIKRSMVAC